MRLRLVHGGGGMSNPEMRARDRDYIETRLLAPCTDALDAVERLRQAGEPDMAEDLMVAIRAFTDECRKIRRQFNERIV